MQGASEKKVFNALAAIAKGTDAIAAETIEEVQDCQLALKSIRESATADGLSADGGEKLLLWQGLQRRVAVHITAMDSCPTYIKGVPCINQRRM